MMANVQRVQLEPQGVLQKQAPEYRLEPVEQAVQVLKADVVQEELAHEKWQDIAILLPVRVIQIIGNQSKGRQSG